MPKIPKWYNLIGEGTQKGPTIRTVVFPALARVHTVRDATTGPAAVKKKKNTLQDTLKNHWYQPKDA